MAVYLVTSADVGAPSLSGTNGAGCTVFDYILNTVAGLTIAYTGTNKRVYTMPNGDVIRIVHDSAVTGQQYFMLVRAAESASAVDTIVDPYPTPAVPAWSGSPPLRSRRPGRHARHGPSQTPREVAWAGGGWRVRGEGVQYERCYGSCVVGGGGYKRNYRVFLFLCRLQQRRLCFWDLVGRGDSDFVPPIRQLRSVHVYKEHNIDKHWRRTELSELFRRRCGVWHGHSRLPEAVSRWHREIVSIGWGCGGG